MSLTIGRGTFADPDEVVCNGRQVTFTVELGSTTVEQMQAYRQQFLGLVNNRDEDVVAVTWSEDSTFDGFYRPVSASVPSSALMLSNGYVPPASITLERVVGGHASPQFEVILQSVVRTNGHGITAPEVVVGGSLLDAALSVGSIDLRPDLIAATARARSSSITSINWQIYRATAPIAATSYRFTVPAEYFYQDASRIEVKYGSNWYPVAGTDVPERVQWRISNGMVRLTSAPDNATSGTLEVNSNGAWESRNVAHYSAIAGRQEIGRWGGYSTGIMTMKVVRNAPEQVTVSVPSSTGGEVTYSLQRFARIVTAAWTSPSSTSLGCGMGVSHTAAGTSITGGIRVTSNDANGNRCVFGVAGTKTVDTTNTNVYEGGTSGTMFMGVELNGSSAITGDAAADLVDQFIGQVAWRQRVVPR